MEVKLSLTTVSKVVILFTVFIISSVKVRQDVHIPGAFFNGGSSSWIPVCAHSKAISLSKM